MTGNVIPIKPSMDISKTLRDIADDIESGVINPNTLTVIAVPYIYQLGVFSDEDAVSEAVFSCNYAIHKIMNQAFQADEGCE